MRNRGNRPAYYGTAFDGLAKAQDGRVEKLRIKHRLCKVGNKCELAIDWIALESDAFQREGRLSRCGQAFQLEDQSREVVPYKLSKLLFAVELFVERFLSG